MTDSPHLLNDSVYKLVIWDNAVNLVLNAIYLKAPWLRTKILKSIFEYIVFYYTDKLFEAMANLIDTSAIIAKDKKAAADYRRVSIVLKSNLINYGPNSETFLKSKEEAKNAFSEYMRFRTGA